MNQIATLNEKVKRGAEDAGRYFRYMAEFVGFTQAHADAIKESRYIIEKHIPDIVAQFYTNLLDYAPTRKVFLKKDGTIAYHSRNRLTKAEFPGKLREWQLN